MKIACGGTGKANLSLKASNGRTILTGQHHADRAGAENGVRSVRENALDDANFELKRTKDGRSHFVLKARNGQVIGQSQMYASVRRHAPEADLDDQAKWGPASAPAGCPRLGRAVDSRSRRRAPRRCSSAG